MATISVELPQDLQEFVETKVRQGRFTSANDYLIALIDAARNERLAVETALLAGLESGPATEWTRQEWQDMKQRVSQRHQES